MTTIAPTAPATAAPVEVLDDTSSEIKVRFPVLALEGVDTGDGRYLTPGSLTHRALPISLLAQPHTAHGGQDPPAAQLVGNITSLTRSPGPEVISPRTGQPYGSDVGVWSGEGVIDGDHEFADLVRKQYLRGVSVDLASVDAELLDEETAALSDNPQRTVTILSAEIGAATLVCLPAFGDAYVELVGEGTMPEPLAASAFPPGLWLVPQPMWRSPDLGDLVPSTPCATRKPSVGELTVGTNRGTVVAAGTGTVIRPPLSYFTDPGFTEETPITIEDPDENGWRRAYGHIGVWDRPHIGFNGKPVYIPKSSCDYAEFLYGGFRARDENGVPRIVAVGHLTVSPGHADTSLSADATRHYYDHSGYAWCDVAAGDDAVGPWVNGVCKRDITEEQIDTALAHPPSGDWRPIRGRGGIELVAISNVNTPGFGVNRVRVASGEVQALVASSGVRPRRAAPSESMVLDYDTIAERVVDRMEHRQAMTALRASLLTELDDAPQRVAALLAALDEGGVGPKALQATR